MLTVEECLNKAKLFRWQAQVIEWKGHGHPEQHWADIAHAWEELAATLEAVAEGPTFIRDIEVSTSDPVPAHRLRLIVDGEDVTSTVDEVWIDSTQGRVTLCGSRAAPTEPGKTYDVRICCEGGPT
jgi:hypothetical protein